MLYWGWKCLCPSGCLTEQSCKDIYAQFFPQAADSSLYAGHVYRALFSRKASTANVSPEARQTALTTWINRIPTPSSPPPTPSNCAFTHAPSSLTAVCARKAQRLKRRISCAAAFATSSARTSFSLAPRPCSAASADTDRSCSSPIPEECEPGPSISRRKSATPLSRNSVSDISKRAHWTDTFIIPERVTFSEYAQALSALLRGSPEEKLAFAFHLYDVNMDGRVTIDEMIEMSRAIYALLGKTF